MILSDNDIIKLLPEIKIETNHPDYPFNNDEQVQPCSIDLRLSNVFWKAKKNKIMDLRKSFLLEVAPRLYWEKIELKPHECITLKKGELLLGRIYEKLTIPCGYKGEIHGRSSFARLGLQVHLSSGLLNPGYSGHMALQLVNFNNNSLKIFPYISICQMTFTLLSNKSKRIYGKSEELESKYMDDDGGPSYWWREKSIRRLQEQFTKTNVAIAVQEQIIKKLGVENIGVLERLTNHIETIKPSASELDSSAMIIDSFSKSEQKLKNKQTLIKSMLWGIPSLMTSSSLAVFLTGPYKYLHILLYIMTAISMLLFIFWHKYDVIYYFTPNEVKHNSNHII